MQPTKTAPTGWLAAAVAVALAMASATAIIMLISLWFVVLPILALVLLAGAGTCFAVSRSWPPGLAYGFAVLSSAPLAILFMITYLALTSVH